MGKDKLFILIKSLTVGEKAFFSRHSRTHAIKNKPDYVRLFEFIDEMEVYDDATVKKHFEGEKFTGQLARKKSQLRDKIIESLSLFHSSKSGEGLLRQQMNVLPALREKAIYDPVLLKEFRKQIKSIKEAAQEREYFDLLIKLADWERELIHLQKDRNKKGTKILDVIKEVEYYQEQLTQEIQLQNMYSQLKILVAKDVHFRMPENKNMLINMFYNLPEEESHPPLSRKSLLYYYYVKSNYYRVNGKPLKAYDYAKKRVELYETMNKCSFDATEYKRILCYQLIAANHAKISHDFFEILEKVKTCGRGEENPYTLNIVLFQTLVFWLEQFEVDKAVKVAEEIEAQYDVLLPTLQTGKAAAYCYYLALVYWLDKQFGKAVYRLNQLINNYETSEEGKSFVYLGRIMQLAIYYDYRDNNLENRLNSARRVMVNQGLLFEFEEIVFAHFRRLIRCANKTEKLKVVGSFYDSLIAFRREFPQRANFAHGCMKIWCEKQGVLAA